MYVDTKSSSEDRLKEEKGTQEDRDVLYLNWGINAHRPPQKKKSLGEKQGKETKLYLLALFHKGR